MFNKSKKEPKASSKKAKTNWIEEKTKDKKTKPGKEKKEKKARGKAVAMDKDDALLDDLLSEDNMPEQNTPTPTPAKTHNKVTQFDDFFDEDLGGDDGFGGFDGFGTTFNDGLGFKTKINKPKVNSNAFDSESKTEQPVESDEPKKEYNKKTNKARTKAQKGEKSGFFFFRLPLWGKIASCAGAVLVVVILCGVLFGGKSKDTYYSIMQDVVLKERGTFRYVLDIQRSEAENTQTELQSMDLNSLNSASTEEAPTQQDAQQAGGTQQTDATQDTDATQQTDDAQQTDDTEEPQATAESITDVSGERVGASTRGGSLTDSWNTAEGTSEENQGFPNIRVTIEGVTLDNTPDKLNTEVNVSLATKNFNDRFTTITAKDGFLYIDIEQMSYWLSNSKDACCVALARTLPGNTKYVKIPIGDVSIPEWYCDEDVVASTEASSGSATTLSALQWWRGVTDSLSELFGNMSSLGETGITQNDGVYNLAIGEASSADVLNTFKSMLCNRASIFNAIVSARASDSLDEEQAKVLQLQQGNFLASTDELYRHIISLSPSDANLQMKGMARRYETTNGFECVEGSLATQLTYEGVTYTISFGGQHTSEGREITLTPGNEGDASMQTSVYDVIHNMFAYFNPTSIDVSMREGDVYAVYHNTLKALRDSINRYMEAPTVFSDIDTLLFLTKYKDIDEENANEYAMKAHEALMAIRAATILNVTKGASYASIYGKADALAWLFYDNTVQALLDELGIDEDTATTDDTDVTEQPTETEAPTSTEAPEPTATPAPVTDYTQNEYAQFAYTDEAQERVYSFTPEISMYQKDGEPTPVTLLAMDVTTNGLSEVHDTLNLSDFTIVAATGEVYAVNNVAELSSLNITPLSQLNIDYDGLSGEAQFKATLFAVVPPENLDGAHLYYQNRLDMGAIELSNTK